jgi:hypothetical protein
MTTSILRRAGLLATLTVAAAASAPTVAVARSEPPHMAAEESLTRGAFHDAMRKLWEDHITWTRLYIVSATGEEDLPDTQATADRLIANQADIGNAIRPFYGDEAGDQLTALLTDHIVIATEVIAAGKVGDQGTLDETLERWYANGDDIAVFLSGANPDNWPEDALKGHMRTHLELTLEEAVARLEGRYEDSIASYEEVHAQILAMADMLSDGIIAQFPDMFAARASRTSQARVGRVRQARPVDPGPTPPRARRSSTPARA